MGYVLPQNLIYIYRNLPIRMVDFCNPVRESDLLRNLIGMRYLVYGIIILYESQVGIRPPNLTGIRNLAIPYESQAGLRHPPKSYRDKKSCNTVRIT